MASVEEIGRALRMFPAGLRALVEAELAAGNAVIEVGHSFPAPPVGAFVMMARPVSSDAPAAAGLSYTPRNASLYAGWFTDGDKRFFVVNPPAAEPPTMPDMDAIRAAHEPPPWSPPPPALAGEFTITFDFRGEMVTYREADRQTDVTCTVSGGVTRVERRTLGDWWYAGEKRSRSMTEAEREAVLLRIADHLRRAEGLTDVRFAR